MFAQYLILFLCVVEFCKSAQGASATALNDKNRIAATNFFMKCGCNSKATAKQLAAAEKCFMAASKKTLYFQKALDAVKKGKCKASAKDTAVFSKFCHSIISVQDSKTKTLIECIGKVQKRYPDPKTIAATPECKAFLPK